MTIQQFNKLTPDQQEQLRLQWHNVESGVPMISRMLFEDWLREYAPDPPPFDRDLLTAFKRGSFPSNPRPFLRALDAGVAAHGSEWIKSPEARALLWVVMAQTHGQLAVVDSLREHEELSKFF